jgi:nicotinamidase/pyrazinamidase
MKTVFFDVDTQLDFLFPTGALYVPGAEKIAPALAELTTFAAENEIQIVSTLDSHRENDPEFKIWKPHCVIGTHGHQKYSRTITQKQIFVPKHTIDVFESERLREVIDKLQAEHYVVYGLATDYCVRTAAFGLLKHQARVEVVTDAIKGINSGETDAILQNFEENGGFLTTTQGVFTAYKKGAGEGKNHSKISAGR